MDSFTLIVVVIVLGALAVDGTRAYRALPALVNRLRGRSRFAGRSAGLGVDSDENSRVPISKPEPAGREKE